jgi:cytochrome P450
MTAAFTELVSRPEYVQPLREEVREAVKQHGFTAAACYQMHKLDSFLKESFRMNPVQSGKLCHATGYFP